MKKTLILLGILTIFFPSISFAVSPQTSSNWSLFKGNTSFMINNNYASIIYDTDNNSICEDSDLSGAVQVGVSPKGTWAAGLWYLYGSGTTTGFQIPALDDYRTRGLCLRYYSTGTGYHIEHENAFFYNTGTSGTSSTTQLFLGGFSYGEILETLILLMIFILLFFSELRLWIFGNRVEGRIKIDKTKNEI